MLCWQYLAFDHNAHEISDAINIARCLGLDAFKIASPFDVGWDEPGIQPAMIEPATLEFNPNSERRLSGNWNPFPGEIAAKTIAREFEIGWREKAVREPQRRYGSTERSQHTCHWLYKNIVMDANGRIFPCCAAPGPGRDLTFATFPVDAGDPFNSAKHRLARLSFANKEAYENEKPDREPYCVNCGWNQTNTDIDNAQVEQYLRSVGSELFNADSIQMLCSW